MEVGLLCIITADKKWEQLLRKQIEQKYAARTDKPIIKSLRDGTIGELKNELLRKMMATSRKVIVGFSENSHDLETFTAYSILTNMLEKGELCSKKLLPVKITENSVIPEVLNEFIAGHAYDKNFIDELVKALGERWQNVDDQSFLR